MRKIIYYVATSLDGYIAGPDDDISNFAMDGEGVARYLLDLKDFAAVIMGRRTYEFGYRYGLEAGKPAYPEMQHYIFSDTLQFENQDPLVHVEKINLESIILLKQTTATDIYLCGGGTFAGWLLDNDQIDQLRLKINPIVLGDGIRLFGNSKKNAKWLHQGTQQFAGGLQIANYDLART